jgi:hypothetical protein
LEKSFIKWHMQLSHLRSPPTKQPMLRPPAIVKRSVGLPSEFTNRRLQPTRLNFDCPSVIC